MAQIRAQQVEVPEFLSGLTPANTDAYAAFLAQGIPGPRAEAFKYTHLPRALAHLKVTPDAALHVGVGAVDGRALVDLNTALTSVRYSELTNTVLHVGVAGTFANPRGEFRVPAGTVATLDDTIRGAENSWQNIYYNIVVEDGATLHHYRHTSGPGVVTQTTDVRVEGSGQYIATHLNMAAGTVRQDVNIDLCGDSARGIISAASLLRNAAHGDLTACIRHLAPHTYSSQRVRNVLQDSARGVYQGKIFVDRVAQKTDGYQLSNTLLMSPLAEMDVKPELEIYADDVKCSHGATTGALDDNQMFYLMSRGLPRDAAQAMLLEAFIAGLFDDMDTVRGADYMEAVTKWLQGGES